VMIAAPGATAVTRPAVLTVATPAALVDHVTVRATPGSARTATPACCVWPGARTTFDGATTTLVTPRVTVTCALAFWAASAVAVAVIVVVPGATPVTTPVVALTVATAALLDANVAVLAAAPVVDTEALNVAEPPTVSDALGGEIEIAVTASGVGGGCTTETSSPQPTRPPKASAPVNSKDRVNFCILNFPLTEVGTATALLRLPIRFPRCFVPKTPGGGQRRPDCLAAIVPSEPPL
jgi:hypothetical protein